MNRKVSCIVSLLSPLLAASWALAETTVTMENTHLCCRNCVTGAKKAVKDVEGAKLKCDQKAQKITLSAPDDATAQKAVDALLAAGYFGKTTGAKTADDSGAHSGNVKSLVVSGFHNCCKKCTTALNDTIKNVPGASGEVAQKETTVTVTGDYDAAKLVQAFNDAGFHVKVSEK